MRIVLFVITIALASAGMASAAGDGCCADGKCCANAACCAHKESPAPADEPDLQPAREYARVTFVDPVWVGDKVLMGQYVIEHDLDRMARGRPCTHIYAANDRRFPVVTFHCVHLIRPESGKTSVTLRRDYNATGKAYKLVEFQFAGARDAHGVPGVRGVPLVR